MPDVADPIPADEKKDKKKAPPRDPAREVVETIVFVVVLVLLLKLFVTEAFVIPTGSMAETLYGYQKIITCPKCGEEFPVNSHDEVEGRDGKRTPVGGYVCPNCRYRGQIKDFASPPANNTGDRVLVLKPLFEIREPRRGDVVVFKYPEKPQEKGTAQNYIKRAMGFGGETVGIYRGDLFVTRSLEYPPDAVDAEGQPLYPRPENPLDLWKPPYMYSNVNQHNPRATEFFRASRDAGFKPGIGFEVVRKGEDQLLADLRLVWDNDRQPAELAGRVEPRWYAASAGWTADHADQPRVFAHDKPEMHWIRYRHLVWATPPGNGQWNPEHWTWDGVGDGKPFAGPVDNFLGYNAGIPLGGVLPNDPSDKHWVGDLAAQCEAKIGANSTLVLELSKGVNRFRATFTPGTVTLSRIGPGSDAFGSPSRPCRVAADKTYTLRFANIDCRLWVWVDGKLVDFGDEANYQPPTPDEEAAFTDPKGVPDVSPEGWTRTNDVEAPAGIGAQGQVQVQSLKLHRDIFYTRRGNLDPAQASLYYVQPGHYLCLGDNSAHSSDSRDWGTVPERLMLGKAVFVFWPVVHHRAGFIK
jgi:signal peptidase I